MAGVDDGQGSLLFEGDASAEQPARWEFVPGRWQLGGRWGNQWTEIVLGDYEDVVLVRTHLPVLTGKPHTADYEPVDGWLEKVARYADALNAMEES